MTEFDPSRLIDGLLGAGAASIAGAILSYLVNRRNASTQHLGVVLTSEQRSRELLSADEQTFRKAMLDMCERLQQDNETCRKQHAETQEELLKSQRERVELIAQVAALDAALRTRCAQCVAHGVVEPFTLQE